MQSKANTVEAYLSDLSDERRQTISDVRKIILKNLQPGFEEGMQYGMIGYFVPHSLYPAGYHCKPAEPLPFLSLASQKNYCSFYAMALFSNPDALARFKSRWKETNLKLDMGKSCIRFKTPEGLALDLIAEHIRDVTVKKYIEIYEQSIRR